MKSKLNRRDFITKSSFGVIGATSGLIHLGNGGSLNAPGANIQELPKIKEYRILGRTGFKVSDIGCGAVQVSTEGLIKAVLSSGINMIDTSESGWQYQEVIGKVISKSDRQSIFVNTKIMVSEKETPDEVVQRVKNFLQRMKLTYFDAMMLWNINSIKETKNEAFYTAFRRLRDDGLVKFRGVSCHGSNYVINPKDSMQDVISAVVESDRYDLVMFVYNYVQHEMGENILKICAEKNIGTLLMKTDPFGGALMWVSKQIKESISKNDSITPANRILYDKIIQRQKEAQPFLQKYGYLDEASFKEAAISFVNSNPAVSSTLISIRNFDDVNDYVRLSGSRLDAAKTSFIKDIKQSYGFSYCRHACGKCEKSCPNGVPVNTIMRYNHYFTAQKRYDYAKEKYSGLKGNKADKCASCEGFCESTCPHNVLIHPMLTLAHQNLKEKV